MSVIFIQIRSHQSDFTDQILTKLILGNSSAKIHAEGLRVASLAKVTFESCQFVSSDGKTLASSGPGELKFMNLPYFWKSINIRFRNIRLGDDLTSRISHLDPEGRFSRDIRIDGARIAFRQKNQKKHVHILSLTSKDAVLKGGFELENGRVSKANALIFSATGSPLFKARWHDIIPPS